MPTTTNKGYSVPTTGTETGTWGDDLNTNSFGIIDSNVGGITSVSLSGSNVNLSASQSQTAIVRMTGALVTDVTVTTLCVGFTFVENLTSGAHSVTFTNGVAGVVIPQGSGATVLTDAANGARIVSSSGGFATGTAIAAFAQATAPVGWTKSASLDDYALRLTNGSGGGSTGGSTAFTTVFAARTISQANLPNYNLTVLDPGHLHSGGFTTGTEWLQNFQHTGGLWPGNEQNPGSHNTGGAATNITVNSGGSGTAFNFAVNYLNVISCSKN